MTKRIELNLLFKLSYLNLSFELTLGYLNPALNNSALETNAVADPDLQIRGEGHSHPDPVIRGGELVSNKIFSALHAPVWSKNMGGLGPSGPSPGSATGEARNMK